MSQSQGAAAELTPGRTEVRVRTVHRKVAVARPGALACR
jgi:hypothetical protein